MTTLSESYRKAFGVLTSSRLVDAMDVAKEDSGTRDRYGVGSPKHQGDGAPLWNEQLLVARRLVEAGVRVVTGGLRLLGHARPQFFAHAEEPSDVRPGTGSPRAGPP